MNSIPFNEEKAIAAVLFILNQIGGEIDMHKLAKTLYFADQKHMVKYGRPIIGDEYAPMDFGPVPSMIYDAIKGVNNPKSNFKLFSENLKLSTEKGVRSISTLNKPDMDELSQSDIECLIESINENKALSFDALIEKSHGQAWTNAANKGLDRILIEDIAKEGGANDDLISYIKDNISDYHLKCC